MEATMASFRCAISRDAAFSKVSVHFWTSTLPFRKSSLIPGLTLTSSGGGARGWVGASQEHETSGKGSVRSGRKARDSFDSFIGNDRGAERGAWLGRVPNPRPGGKSA